MATSGHSAFCASKILGLWPSVSLRTQDCLCLCMAIIVTWIIRKTAQYSWEGNGKDGKWCQPDRYPSITYSVRRF